MRLAVESDGEAVAAYAADGIVISTPTGSTAYSLSAGGPIINPNARVIAMTPICPHTLSNRTIIFEDSVHLKIFNRTSESRLLVAMDGQRNRVVTEGSPIEVTIRLHSITAKLRTHTTTTSFVGLRG